MGNFDKGSDKKPWVANQLTSKPVKETPVKTPTKSFREHRWKPGQSGNPKGRALGGRSLAEKIRAKAGEDAGVYVDELHKMALNRRIAPKTRGEIIRLLLERGYGKTPTDINLNTASSLDLQGLDLSTLTDKEIDTLYDAAEKTAAIIASLKKSPESVH